MTPLVLWPISESTAAGRGGGFWVVLSRIGLALCGRAVVEPPITARFRAVLSRPDHM
jgi:hypothetical protein